MKSSPIKKLIFISLNSLLLFSFIALCNEQISFPWMQWKRVGKAELTWGFWKIYDSELYTPSGEYTGNSLALIITYNRNIDAEDLLDATIDQWLHLGFSKTQIDSWLPSMQKAWPNVNKGDKLIYLLQENGKFFYHPKNSTINLHSELDNKILSKAFIDIWLSPKTSYPELRKTLINDKTK